MSYGNGDVQWMRAGRGVIHEEMWDLSDADWTHRRIEIFQLWVNLPKRSKGMEPSLHLLRNQDIPNIDCGNGVSVKVISGSLLNSDSSSPPSSSSSLLLKSSLQSEDSIEGEKIISRRKEENQDEDLFPGIVGPGSAVSESPVSILHVNLAKSNSAINLNIDRDCTATVYVRRGSLKVQGRSAEKEGSLAESENEGDSEIRAGDCVVYRMTPQNRREGYGQRDNLSQGIVTLQSGSEGLGTVRASTFMMIKLLSVGLTVS